MFENLFTRGAILKRYRTAPLFEERLRYLNHCAQAGVRHRRHIGPQTPAPVAAA